MSKKNRNKDVAVEAYTDAPTEAVTTEAVATADNTPKAVTVDNTARLIEALATIKKLAKQVAVVDDRDVRQMTVCRYFLGRLLTGATRDDIIVGLAEAVKAGEVRYNARHLDIIEKKARQELSAFLRDIRTSRKGWWSNYELDETTPTLKVTKKFSPEDLATN